VHAVHRAASLTGPVQAHGASVVTVGHGTLDASAFTSLLVDAGIALLVDVRRFPGSRRNPQFGQDEMRRSLGDAGIAYRCDAELGGFRRARPDSPHTALRQSSFRGYADHMATPAFAAAIGRLVDEASRHGPRAVTIMCPETLGWRCHRRLIADHLVMVRAADVRHLMHDSSLAAHRVTDGARLETDGMLVYDAGQPRLSAQGGPEPDRPGPVPADGT
jgi:uncharacterized protein (DUF488 family)